MRQWVLAQLRQGPDRPLIVIDRHATITDAEAHAADKARPWYRVDNWFAMRKVWEQCGRYSHAGPPPIVIVTGPDVQQPSDLPYDIEQGARCVILRIPGDPAIQQVVLGLADELSDEVVTRIEHSHGGDRQAAITAAAGLPSATINADDGPTQFRCALRLHTRQVGDAVVDLARAELSDPLALAVLRIPDPDFELIQDAWESWVQDDSDSRWTHHFEAAASELAGLFTAGILTPSSNQHAKVPSWALVGIATAPSTDRIDALLAAPPESSEAVSFDVWVEVATWWAQVRNLLGQTSPCPEPLREEAWSAWEVIDSQFHKWLRNSYGAQLSRSWVNGPVSVDKIQPFLERRMTRAGRIMLIVLDGCGLTQWARITELWQSTVLQPGAALAMLPTLTNISRQAIAAGATPSEFPESIGTTRKEPSRWAAAWRDTTQRSEWVRIDGAHVSELDQVPFSGTEALGLVISATDELMHGAELLGDAGLHAGIKTWMATGVLDSTVKRATDEGFEVWVTADHGNLEVVPTPGKREGLHVERAGTRVRQYASEPLRDAAGIEGLRWNELPGLPEGTGERLLFAPGRTGWGSAKVSHGGLSLDEVLVPFVRVSA